VNSAEQVVFVLQLILVLGPLAVYFLVLGLVNSLARPCLVNACVDFLLLTVAFIPVLLVPLITLIQHGHSIIALSVLVAILTVFFSMLPDRRSRWVVYNCTIQQCTRLMERAARRVGGSVALADDQARLSPSGISIQISALPWLRNLTLRLAGGQGNSRSEFLAALEAEMAGEAMLPSPTGASLVVIGTGLLGVPMWYVLHHISAIVDVVKHILFA
jgi:hypothetical protein